MRPIEIILAKLLTYTRHGANYRACCPGHDGDNPTTLSLTEVENEKPLIHCFKGCDPEVVLGALGLMWADLFPNGDERRNDAHVPAHRRRRPRPPKTDTEKMILMLATTHICGLILGPVPAALPDEALAQYLGIAELLWEVYTEKEVWQRFAGTWARGPRRRIGEILYTTLAISFRIPHRCEALLTT